MNRAGEERGLFRRESLIAALAVATALAVGALVLQRYVAATRTAAIILVAAWYGAFGVGVAIYALLRPRLRLPVLGAFLAVVVGTAAVGYWTGFRDRRVDEDVVVAKENVAGAERADVLAGESAVGSPSGAGRSDREKPRGPVSVASGTFIGQDGHAGTGHAEVVARPDGTRLLTFTRFDVDPGVDVQVYLTPEIGGVDDRVELGGLKGNIGDQQYEIPADADLARYDSVVLWCVPFTVRIATAELS